MGFVGAGGVGDFVLGIWQGFDPMCLYSKYSEFCGEFKNGGKAPKRILTLPPPPPPIQPPNRLHTPRGHTLAGSSPRVLCLAAQINFLYFITFLVVGAYILSNWFLAVVAYSMSNTRLAVPAFEALQPRHQIWLTYVLTVLPWIPRSPKPISFNRILRKMEPKQSHTTKYKIWKARLRMVQAINSKSYAAFLCFIETFYFGVLCSMHWRQPSWLTTFQQGLGTAVMFLWLLDLWLRSAPSPPILCSPLHHRPATATVQLFLWLAGALMATPHPTLPQAHRHAHFSSGSGPGGGGGGSCKLEFLHFKFCTLRQNL